MARLCCVLLLCLPAGCAVSFDITNAPRAPNDCTGQPNRPGCSV